MDVSKIGKRIGDVQFVLCKKSIKTFKVGKYYHISGMYGNPQGAHEAGYKYMDTDFLNIIIIMDKYPGDEFYFDWKDRDTFMAKYETEGIFQDYFVVDIKEERRKKLSNINETYK